MQNKGVLTHATYSPNVIFMRDKKIITMYQNASIEVLLTYFAAERKSRNYSKTSKYFVGCMFKSIIVLSYLSLMLKFRCNWNNYTSLKQKHKQTNKKIMCIKWERKKNSKQGRTWQFELEDLDSKPLVINDQLCDLGELTSLSFVTGGR